VVRAAGRHVGLHYKKEDSVDGAGILLGAVAAASVVVSGALYALFFALGRLHSSALFSRVAAIAYGCLVVSSLLVVRSMNLHGGWLWIVALMLAGYLLAPFAIWHLSAATHAGADEPAAR
jgi:hypothetical protein